MSLSNKIHLFQPGSSVRAISGNIGTMGPFTLTNSGEILHLTTGHQLGDSTKGMPLYLYPDLIPIGSLKQKIDSKRTPYNVSLRIKGIQENTPIVLKSPIVPENGRRLIKSSGFRSPVTFSNVVNNASNINLIIGEKEVEFSDQIQTDFMGTCGDSGSYILTADTFEPIGLLFAGNNRYTYHNKLVNVSKVFDLKGFYSPISLPKNSPISLKYVVSSLIPDGIFYQKSPLKDKNPDKILSELGITQVNKNEHGIYTMTFEDLMLTGHPHKPGDQGSLLFNKDNNVLGLAVSGNENTTAAIKINKVLDSLNLEIIINYTNKSYAELQRYGYWKTRCQKCGATVIPKGKCIFCGILHNE